MKDEIDSVALARYLSGECDRQERAEIERWIEADPAHARLVESLRKTWEHADTERPHLDVDALWGRVASQMDAPAERPPIRRAESTAAPIARAPARPAVWRWAAGLAAALLIGILAPQIRKAVDSPRPAESVVEAFREVATQRGQRAEIRLTDGTAVTLGVESRIRIPSSFGTRSRTIDLEGEAYFEVAHEETRPFVVRTASAVTEDLGTAFGVTEYPGDRRAQVVVTEGSVALRAATTERAQSEARASHLSVVLKPGQLGTLAPDGVPVVRNVDVDAYLAWRDGRLSVRDVPLRDVIPRLERWYDVRVELADSALASRLVTASLSVTAPIDDVARRIAAAMDMRYERDGTVLRFHDRK